MASNSRHNFHEQALVGCAVVAIALCCTERAEARDANRSSGYHTPAHTIPNPFAAPQSGSPSDRAGDAYATGFAIGLGTALITKQREDEAKRLREQSAPRR